MAQVFEGAEPWTDINHVVTRIAGRFYDITGEVDITGGLPYHVMSRSEIENQAPHRAGGRIQFAALSADAVVSG